MLAICLFVCFIYSHNVKGFGIPFLYIVTAARFTTNYYTLHVFNVLSTFKHSQNMMFSSVNTYNFHSNVKEIKKISANLLFRQRLMVRFIALPQNTQKHTKTPQNKYKNHPKTHYK